MRLHTLRSRTAAVGGAAIAVGALGVALFAALGSTSANADDANDTDPAIEYATVEVRRVDLAVGHEATGSVEPSATLEIGSPTNGTVVDVTDPGELIEPGDVIATVDDRLVVAISGTIPMWRDLGVGDEGPDVQQLEAALVDLGFDPDGNVTVDDEFTDATASMVDDWHVSLGTEETGEVTAASVVVLAEPMRVATVNASTGAQVTGADPLLTLASVGQVVTALVPVADAVTLDVDDNVTLRLPDRTEVAGTVRSVTLGTDATVRSAVVEFDDPDLVPPLDGVTIDISWTDVLVEDAPTLPADVFRRLDSGIYVVDLLADDGSITSVQVEPGVVVGTTAEVSGVPIGAAVIRP